MDNREFTKYLATGEFSKVEANAEDAAVAVVAVEKQDPFFALLANLCAVEMLAKDYHYRCMGKAFYGEHLLADLIHDVGDKADDIFEIRYMGELQVTPPFKADVAREAVRIIDDLPMMANENGLIEALYERTNALVGLVDKIKDSPIEIASGTTAVLDAISEKALQAVGFIKRTMTGGDMSEKIDADEVTIV